MPKRDPKTGLFLKAKPAKRARARVVRAAPKRNGLKGHKRGCQCVIHARKAVRARVASRANPRVRGSYPAHGVGVCAELTLNTTEFKAWRSKQYGPRNRILRHANTLSKKHGRKTVVIKSPGGKELERWRAF